MTDEEADALLGQDWGDEWDTLPEAPPLVTKTGKVLTDADIQALADEAEAGYTEEQVRAAQERATKRAAHLKAYIIIDEIDRESYD